MRIASCASAECGAFRIFSLMNTAHIRLSYGKPNCLSWRNRAGRLARARFSRLINGDEAADSELYCLSCGTLTLHARMICWCYLARADACGKFWDCGTILVGWKYSKFPQDHKRLPTRLIRDSGRIYRASGSRCGFVPDWRGGNWVAAGVAALALAVDCGPACR